MIKDNSDSGIEFLKNHLNVSWLRPENALWNAIASSIISQEEIKSPSLEIGCGNGINSFITAGGNFSEDFDWYLNVETEGFWEKKDIYDTCKINNMDEYIIEKPDYKFTCGLDHKNNLLRQAESLELYDELILHDANQKLPFDDAEFKTVFSNVLYWLNDPEYSLGEIHRILQKGGRALLCLPNSKFKEYSPTFSWREEKSSLLKKLNGGRSDSMKWLISYQEFFTMVDNVDLRIVYHSYYLSSLTLLINDIGLRPISPCLIKMANKLNVEDRQSIKSEWIDTVLEILTPLYQIDKNSKEEGGFHFFVLEKNR